MTTFRETGISPWRFVGGYHVAFSKIGKSIQRIFPLILATAIVLPGCTAFRDTKTASSYFEEGAVLVKQGKYDEAIKKYMKGLRREPHSAVGYNYLGIAYRFKYEQLRSLKWRDKEIEAFKKAIELDPNFYLPYVNLGTTHYSMGNRKEASRYLKKSLEIYPEHPSKELIDQMIQEGEREGR